MSARAPFFPQPAAGKPNSRPEFTPDPQSPLHSGEPNGPPFVPFSASGQHSGTTASNGRPPTAGLGGVQARRSSTVNGNGKPPTRVGMNMMRPGTADPHALRLGKQAYMPPPPIVAPSPVNPEPRISSLLNLSSSDGLKTPYPTESTADSGEKRVNGVHISTSEPTLKFRPVSRQSGPQRVPVNQASHFSPYQKDNSGGPELNDDDRVRNVANRQATKRRREEDEYNNESFTPYGKRFKSHDEPDDHDNLSSRGHSSPAGASASHRSLHDADVVDKNHLDKNLRSPSQSPQDLASYSARDISSQPGALQELLGVDPDEYVKKHMDAYSKMAQRFSDCTINEWISAADEIAKDFTSILDRMKSHMDSKLKLYAKFHTSVESHHDILNQRQAILDSASKRLVAQSGSVLK